MCFIFFNTCLRVFSCQCWYKCGNRFALQVAQTLTVANKISDVESSKQKGIIPNDSYKKGARIKFWNDIPLFFFLNCSSLFCFVYSITFRQLQTIKLKLHLLYQRYETRRNEAKWSETNQCYIVLHGSVFSSKQNIAIH